MVEVSGYCSAGPLSKDDFIELHHHLLVKPACDISGSKYKRSHVRCGGTFHLEEEDSGRSKAARERRACYGVTIKLKKKLTNKQKQAPSLVHVCCIWAAAHVGPLTAAVLTRGQERAPQA